MLKALKEKDLQFLESVISDEGFECSFGGCSSKDDFVIEWALPNPESPLWPLMHGLLLMGGKFSSLDVNGREFKCFNFPYYAADNSIDFGEGVIIEADVPVRQDPKSDAPILALLSHEVVEVLDWRPVETPSHDFNSPHRQAESMKSNSLWVKIKFDDQEGFVENGAIRSALGYRGTFVLEKGQWRLKYFLAGD